jgi:hypothetical protein
MSIDPEILLGLHNSRQNQSSIELQRQILDMQTLQVMNQVRMSQGLPPLVELPKPPPEPESYFWKENPALAWTLLLGLGGPVLVLLILTLLSRL